MHHSSARRTFALFFEFYITLVQTRLNRCSDIKNDPSDGGSEQNLVVSTLAFVVNKNGPQKF